MIDKICPYCNEHFNAENKRTIYCSKSCRRKAWRKRYPKYDINWYLNNQRQTVITVYINGVRTKISGIIKFPHPLDNKCQICGKVSPCLAYHHWGEIKKGEIVKGLWICQNHCHNVVEALEKGILENIVEKYLKLKGELIDKYPNESLKHPKSF